MLATLLSVVLVHATALLGGYACSRLAARSALRADRVAAATSLRNRTFLLGTVFAAVTVFVGIPTGLLALMDWATGQIPVVGSTSVQPVFFFATVLFGPAMAGYVVVSLGTLPAWRDLKDVDVSAWDGARNTTRWYVATLGPQFGLVVLGTTLPAGVAVVVGTALAYCIYTAASPWLFERLNDSRPLTPDERDRLGSVADRDVPIRVVDASETKHAQGFATGVVPGFERVYLTDFLLEELSTEQCRAVAEHEFAHLDRRHLLLRGAVYGLFVVGVASVIAEASAGRLSLVALVVVPVWLAHAAISRRTEYDADRQAATREDATAMVGALDALGEHNLLRRESTVLGSLLGRHPDIERRTARLRDGDAGADVEAATTDSSIRSAPAAGRRSDR